MNLKIKLSPNPVIKQNIKLAKIKNQAKEVLEDLVKPYGIYASNGGLNNGKYHHFFGRDSAITTLLILDAEKNKKRKHISRTALQGLLAISKYQGQKDEPKTGEEFGKIPHEINLDKKEIKTMLKELKKYDQSPWFVDEDGILKNWDSADSTPLWMLCIAKFVEDGHEIPADIIEKYADATAWCLSNIEQMGGYNGWVPSNNQVGRIYGGLKNQSWKDSGTAYLYDNCNNAKYPLHDIFSNAATWAALSYSTVLLRQSHPYLAKQSAQTSKQLKKRFNSPSYGFRMTENDYFAEALDKNNHKLTTPSLDVAMCLACDFRGEVIFNSMHINAIVNRIVSSEFTDDFVGTRTYSDTIKNFNPNDQYHRGPNTYWPFAAVLAAKGMQVQGYKVAAAKLIGATLNGLSNFASLVELYQNHNGDVKIWKNPNSEQTSTLNQAWTAAGVYYGCDYLLRRNEAFIPKLPVDLPYANQIRLTLPAAPIVYDGNLIRLDKKVNKTLKSFKKFFTWDI
jgi:hypothetical protein